MSKVLVIGSGAWGTTISKLLSESGNDTTIWAHEKSIADEINNTHSNSKLLPDIQLPSNLKATISFEDIASYQFIFIVVASQFYLKTIDQIKDHLTSTQIIVSASKGLTKDGETMTSKLAAKITNQIVVFSGPNIAKEIANGNPAATVAASSNINVALQIQSLFTGSNLRIYTSNDVIGVELGGTLKNIIAIAAGIIDGLSLGSNAKAALMTRGIVEIARLSKALGADERTLYGLSGMGDLITTCSSSMSRNHSVGEKLAKGESLDNILENMIAVAEGVNTTKYTHLLAQKMGIVMPFTEEIYRVLFENKSVAKAIKELMSRTQKSEIY